MSDGRRGRRRRRIGRPSGRRLAHGPRHRRLVDRQARARSAHRTATSLGEPASRGAGPKPLRRCLGRHRSPGGRSSNRNLTLRDSGAPPRLRPGPISEQVRRTFQPVTRAKEIQPAMIGQALRSRGGATRTPTRAMARKRTNPTAAVAWRSVRPACQRTTRNVRSQDCSHQPFAHSARPGWSGAASCDTEIVRKQYHFQPSTRASTRGMSID